MKLLAIRAATWLALSVPAMCADGSITIGGTVVLDGYGAGPYSAAQVGDSVELSFDVHLPGSVVIPGQRTDYDLSLFGFEIDINGLSGGSPLGPTLLTVRNDNPVDGLTLQVPLDNGDALGLTFEALASLFASSDLAVLGGDYDLASAATLNDFTLSGPGGVLRMRVETLVIEVPEILQVEILGTIESNSYTSGALGAGTVGGTALLSFHVQAPGFDLVAGQLTNYAIDPATLVFNVGGPTGIAFATPAFLQVQDDFPITDGLRLTEGQLSSGDTFSCELGTLGSFFSSTDITQLANTYDLAPSLLSFSYHVQGSGGLLEITPQTLRIRLPSLGTSYCSANPNSTGLPGILVATGSNIAIDGNLTLSAGQLPNGQFAYFLASRTQGLVTGPNGSQGNLCVLGNIARFNRPGEVGAIAGGSFSFSSPLDDFPEPPNFGISVLAGDTWNFQCWHRDLLNGLPTSNFTDAVELLFR